MLSEIARTFFFFFFFFFPFKVDFLFRVFFLLNVFENFENLEDFLVFLDFKIEPEFFFAPYLEPLRLLFFFVFNYFPFFIDFLPKFPILNLIFFTEILDFLPFSLSFYFSPGIGSSSTSSSIS